MLTIPRVAAVCDSSVEVMLGTEVGVVHRLLERAVERWRYSTRAFGVSTPQLIGMS